MSFIRTTLHSRHVEIVNDPPILRPLAVRDTAALASSSSAIVTLASSSPATTSGASNGMSALGTSSMYLYIFLATIGVMFFIAVALLSGAFVSRSRRRREMEEAMRNGSYVVMNRNNESLVIQKPLMHDAFLGGYHHHHHHSTMTWSQKWGDIMPVSAGLLTRSGAEFRSEAHLRSRERSRPQTGLGNDTQNVNSSPVHTTPTKVRMSVLIAMPSPHPLSNSTLYEKAKRRYSDDSDWSTTSAFSFEEHDLDLPPIEFGVAEVPVVRNVGLDSGSGAPQTTLDERHDEETSR